MSTTVHAIASTDETPAHKPVGPERELLIATLDRAVLDYHSARKELSVEAEEWLYDSESDPAAFSFEWICDNLGLDPSAVLRRIEELNFSRTVSQRHRWLRKKIQSKDIRPQFERAAA